MVEFPEWYDGKNVNEVKFCEEFLKIHPMKSVNGTFFTVEGRVTDEDALRREIYESLKPFFQTGLTKRGGCSKEAQQKGTTDVPMHHQYGTQFRKFSN